MPAVERVELGAFLRSRRLALQPEDLGLRRGARRRTSGLRREEVAELCDMSTDYVARLERGDGPRPSPQMAAALARGLRLTTAERDHLFLLCGHRTPRPVPGEQHVEPGLMRVLDRLPDTPAQIMGPVGETLRQTPLAVALLGKQTHFTGMGRSAAYRWFTQPPERDRYAPEDHELTSRTNVALLRTAATRDGRSSPAGGIATALRNESAEFARLWERQEVGLRFSAVKHLVHPEVGPLDLYCENLMDPDRRQSLLIFTASPGTDSQERLALLSVLAGQLSLGQVALA